RLARRADPDPPLAGPDAGAVQGARPGAGAGQHIPAAAHVAAAAVRAAPADRAHIERRIPGPGVVMKQRIVVVGQGYVGLPLAVRAAQAGHEVVGYDVDRERIKRLAAGESYIEDVPSSELRKILGSGAYRPSAEARSCAGFDVAVITVPTPLRDGVLDL